MPRSTEPANAPLSAVRVLPLAHTRQLGQQIYHYLQSTGSTNADARELARCGAPHGTLVVAETQTAGRGRHDRPWVSPPGLGIYATLLLRPTRIPPGQTPLLTLLAAVADAEAIALTVPNLMPVIKWPNDILVNGRKTAGILAELTDSHETAPCILIGIGINVNTPVNRLPARPLYPATSLAQEAGMHVPRTALLAAYLKRFEQWLARLEAGDSNALIADWNAWSGIKGKRVSIVQETQTLHGTVTGIDTDGALRLQTNANQTTRILSGDLRY